MDKIKSPRNWEPINYILEESSLKDHRDKEVSLNITIEDYIWMTLQAFYEAVDYESYEFLNNAADSDNQLFRLYKVKAIERFRKLFDACDQIGIKPESIIEIGKVRMLAETVELNQINDIIASILDDDTNNNGQS